MFGFMMIENIYIRKPFHEQKVISMHPRAMQSDKDVRMKSFRGAMNHSSPVLR